MTTSSYASNIDANDWISLICIIPSCVIVEPVPFVKPLRFLNIKFSHIKLPSSSKFVEEKSTIDDCRQSATKILTISFVVTTYSTSETMPLGTIPYFSHDKSFCSALSFLSWHDIITTWNVLSFSNWISLASLLRIDWLTVWSVVVVGLPIPC